MTKAINKLEYAYEKTGDKTDMKGITKHQPGCTAVV